VAKIMSTINAFLPLGKKEELEQGYLLTHPLLPEEYTIEKKLGKGGEGQSYLAVDQDGRKKVVKFVAVQSSKSLEETLQKEYLRVNEALGTRYQTFAVNPIDIAIIGDYTEGRNLEEEILGRNKVFSRNEILHFLEKITTEALVPLHMRGLVHKDIKPANIICTTTGDALEYTLIDFGLLRQHNTALTVTASFRGTFGYMRMKEKHEIQDDYYGLAKTVYYLATGKHPEFVGETYEEQHNKKTFGALPFDEGLKKILFRMLGHGGSYIQAEDLLEDIKSIQKGSSVVMERESSSDLLLYSQQKVVPGHLNSAISNLKEEYHAKYESYLPSRVPFDPAFRSRLEEILQDLGYRKDEKLCAFLRPHLDSKNVDVFQFLSEEKKRFTAFTVPEKNLENFVGEFSPDYGLAINFGGASLLIGSLGVGVATAYAFTLFDDPPSALPLLYGIASGFVSFFGCGFASFIVPRDSTLDLLSSEKRIVERPYTLGLLGVTYPFVVAKLSYDFKRIDYAVTRGVLDKESSLLEQALEPREGYTYEHK